MTSIWYRGVMTGRPGLLHRSHPVPIAGLSLFVAADSPMSSGRSGREAARSAGRTSQPAPAAWTSVPHCETSEPDDLPHMSCRELTNHLYHRPPMRRCRACPPPPAPRLWPPVETRPRHRPRGAAAPLRGQRLPGVEAGSRHRGRAGGRPGRGGSVPVHHGDLSASRPGHTGIRHRPHDARSCTSVGLPTRGDRARRRAAI